MKKKLSILLILVLLITLSACTKKEEKDSERFLKEYPQVSEYNVYVYRNIQEIIKILEHGTGIVYLGFPECPWCQAYVPILNEVADIEGLEKIYYYNIYNDRKENTDEYQKIVSILFDYLQYDDEGNKRVFVPAVIAINKGEIVGFDDETAWDTKGFEKPDDYWNEEEVTTLKTKLNDMLTKSHPNMCSSCNED